MYVCFTDPILVDLGVCSSCAISNNELAVTIGMSENHSVDV